MKRSLKLATTFLIGLAFANPCYAQEEAIAESVEVPGTPVEKVKSGIRPLTVAVELTNSFGRLAGTLTESTQLSMKTSFGEASIPMSEIAGVRFPSADDVSTTVVMLNGDSITGAVDIKQLSLETEWGTASIKGSAIQSMLFVPNVQWQATSSLSGKRWNLVDVKPNTSGSPLLNNPAPMNNPANRSSSLPAPNARSGFIIGQ